MRVFTRAACARARGRGVVVSLPDPSQGMTRVVSLRCHSPSQAVLAPAALSTALRFKSFHFYLNLQDPEDTRRYVEEELERLADNHKKDSAAYLHSLLNLSLSYYQAEDFIKAREFAEYTHQKARAYNAKSSLLFLTATTCAHCCTRLADEYEVHVAEAEAKAHTSASLAPKPSVVFSAKRAIRKLREDATRYEGIAARIQARPDMAFMKGAHHAGVNPERRKAYYDGSNSNNANSGDSETKHTAGEQGANAQSETYGSDDEGDDARRDTTTSGTSRARATAARGGRGLSWHEDATDVDEEFEAHYFGDRWQRRRRRPEHAEVRRYYQQQNASVSRAGRYKVPK